MSFNATFFYLFTYLSWPPTSQSMRKADLALIVYVNCLNMIISLFKPMQIAFPMIWHDAYDLHTNNKSKSTPSSSSSSPSRQDSVVSYVVHKWNTF